MDSSLKWHLALSVSCPGEHRAHLLIHVAHTSLTSLRVDSQGQPQASPEPRPSLYFSTVSFQHWPHLWIFDSFLSTFILEIHENIIFSLAIYQVQFLDLVVAERNFTLWLCWVLRPFSEAVSKNAEISIKSLSLCLLLPMVSRKLYLVIRVA